jgi:5-methylcytosine-specific restriction protein A
MSEPHRLAPVETCKCETPVVLGHREGEPARCVVCGRPSKDGYCPDHRPKPWQSSKRRQRMGLSGGAWQTVRQKVLASDMSCCYLCDRLGADQVDHLVEVADGGTNALTNLASCHASCHARKHRDPEWARQRVEVAPSVLRGVGP